MAPSVHATPRGNSLGMIWFEVPPFPGSGKIFRGRLLLATHRFSCGGGPGALQASLTPLMEDTRAFEPVLRRVAKQLCLTYYTNAPKFDLVRGWWGPPEFSEM